MTVMTVESCLYSGSLDYSGRDYQTARASYWIDLGPQSNKSRPRSTTGLGRRPVGADTRVPPVAQSIDPLCTLCEKADRVFQRANRHEMDSSALAT